jgi:hypothetical protein
VDEQDQARLRRTFVVLKHLTRDDADNTAAYTTCELHFTAKAFGGCAEKDDVPLS